MKKNDRVDVDKITEKDAIYNDDEISLTWLFLVLSRQKNIIIAISVLGILLGLSLTLIKHKKYTYFMSLEIGAFYADKIEPIEQPGKVQSDVLDRYFPLVLSKYNAIHPGNKREWKISSENPKGTNVINIKGQGDEKESKFYLSILRLLENKIKEEDERSYKIARKIIKNEIGHTSYRLKILRSEEDLFHKEIKNINKRMSEYIDDIKDYDAFIYRTNKKIGLNREHNNFETLISLMIFNEMNDARQKKTELQYDLQHSLPLKILSSERELLTNNQSQSKKIEEITKLNAKFDSFQELRVLTEPVRSINAVGPGNNRIILAGLILGILIGLITAFIVDKKKYGLSIGSNL